MIGTQIWFFRSLDDEKPKHNEEGDTDLRSKPFLCLDLPTFFPCIIEPAEEPEHGENRSPLQKASWSAVIKLL